MLVRSVLSIFGAAVITLPMGGCSASLKADMKARARASLEEAGRAVVADANKQLIRQAQSAGGQVLASATNAALDAVTGDVHQRELATYGNPYAEE